MGAVFTGFSASFGPVAWLLLIASVLILAISIERTVTLYFRPFLSSSQSDSILKLVQDGQLEAVKEHAANASPLLQEMFEVLFNQPKQAAEDELTLILAEKRTKLQQPLEWLNFFAIISPMLGLLGTIWSMSHSFHELGSSMTAGGMHKMITYLSEAMYATAFGIMLSLISMLALYCFKYRTENCLSRCELLLNRVLLSFNRGYPLS